MQSNRLLACNCSCSPPWAKNSSCCGSKVAGQASSHSPQRIQGRAGSGAGISASVLAIRQLLVLMTGALRSLRLKPIIGPPTMTRFICPWSRPARFNNSMIGVPIRHSTFIGWRKAVPVKVVMRDTNGRPRYTASCTATAVPTFWQTTPIWAGSWPVGTSWPVMILISWRSPPDGYRVGMLTTCQSGVCTACCMAAIARGLLSSMAMTTWRACSNRCRMAAPAVVSVARSRISMSSAVI